MHRAADKPASRQRRSGDSDGPLDSAGTQHGQAKRNWAEQPPFSFLVCGMWNVELLQTVLLFLVAGGCGPSRLPGYWHTLEKRAEREKKRELANFQRRRPWIYFFVIAWFPADFDESQRTGLGFVLLYALWAFFKPSHAIGGSRIASPGLRDSYPLDGAVW